jgi:Xaa-Pro aminopeptidase
MPDVVRGVNYAGRRRARAAKYVAGSGAPLLVLEPPSLTWLGLSHYAAALITCDGVMGVRDGSDVVGQIPVSTSLVVDASVPYRFVERLLELDFEVTVEQEPIMSMLRKTKDPTELMLLQRNAVRLKRALDGFRAGRYGSELSIMQELSRILVESGAECFAFDPSIASGAERLKPLWAGVSTRNIADGDAVVVDCGLRYKNYNTDLAVSWFCGIPPEAWTTARSACDEFHREIGRLTGDLHTSHLIELYDAIFDSHRVPVGLRNPLGHGIGLEVHEAPFISRLTSELLEPWMVICLEPGVNGLDGIGYRDERMYVVADKGLIDITTMETCRVI